MTYSDKLKDPRWQKKRLEIMQRDGFKCVNCEDGSESLNVHHTHEDYKIEPWDHPNATMVTLCKSCHERLHRKLDFVRACLEDMPTLALVWEILSSSGGVEILRAACLFRRDTWENGYESGQAEAEGRIRKEP